MRIPEATVDELLDCWPVGRLATTREDGRPHLVPVVFARAGGDLWSPVDAKPKSGRELLRLRNLRARPEACLLVDRYEGDWSRLWWVRVDADAEVCRGAGLEHSDAAAALRAKYPQYAAPDGALFRGEPTLIRLRPVRIRSWCPGPAPPDPAGAPRG